MIDHNYINKASEILKQGGVVAIPTETVYGLAADASNPLAVKKIFNIKDRPENHPVIVHLGKASQLQEWARDVPNTALTLAKIFWPGPLTLILNKAEHVSEVITGGQDTLGIRVPNHPLTLALLNTFEGGLAAPSANKFGRISPTTAAAVKDELGYAVDFVLDGGPCSVGLESTIVDLTSEAPLILRPGMITQREIEDVLHQSVEIRESSAIRVSGNCKSHYAPKKKTYLMTHEALQKFASANSKQKFSAIVFHEMKFNNVDHQVLPSDPKQYASLLYQTLRELDQAATDAILIEQVPDAESWDAIRDRLLRASA